MSESTSESHNEHELPCQEFLMTAYRLGDETCEEALRVALRKHIDECEPCEGEYSLERNIKALVGRCCGTEIAPQTLRNQVQQRIRQMLSVEHSETVVSDGASVVRTSSTTVRYQSRPPA